MDDEYVIEMAADYARKHGGIMVSTIQSLCSIGFHQAIRCCEEMKTRGIIDGEKLVPPHGYRFCFDDDRKEEKE